MAGGINTESSTNPDVVLTSPNLNAAVEGNMSVAGTLTASVVSGTITDAANVTIVAVGTAATFYPTFVSATTGNLPLGVDAGLGYNPSTNTLTTTTFVGALTGSASGSSGSCTGNAATATTATTANNLVAAGLTGLHSYVKGSLPTATAAGQAIYVSDSTSAAAQTGAVCFSRATGTAAWIDVTTGVAVV